MLRVRVQFGNLLGGLIESIPRKVKLGKKMYIVVEVALPVAIAARERILVRRPD